MSTAIPVSTLLVGAVRFSVVLRVCWSVQGVRWCCWRCRGIFVSLVWGGGRHEFAGVCWYDGELLAGGDGWECPNRFCRLGCRVSMSCFVSIGVSCALYVCLFLEMWTIIEN
jgi:hypothetical protein